MLVPTILVHIVRFSPVPSLEIQRPNGIGLTALAMAVFAIADCASFLRRLSGGTLAALASTQNLPHAIGGLVVLALAFTTLWNYWKGAAWARIIVLVFSVGIAVSEFSTMIDNHGSLAAAMSQPVVFLKFALALFLVYWLNTLPLRGYFRGAPSAADHLHQHLAGKLCTDVKRHAGATGSEWHLAFEHDSELVLFCPWRIVLDENLAFASSAVAEDIEGSQQPRQLLQNLRVKAVRVAPRTSDLIVAFEMGLELQTWSDAPNTQQWAFSNPLLSVTAGSIGLVTRNIKAHNSAEDSITDD